MCLSLTFQRYRYVEAYQVDRKLQRLEQDFISKASISEEDLSRIRTRSHWRAGLVDKCIELLPEAQQQQLKTGRFPDITDSQAKEVEVPAKYDMFKVQQPSSTGLLVPSATDSSFLLRMDHVTPSKKTSAFDTPAKLSGSINNSFIELSNYRSPSILHGRFPSNFGDLSTPHNWDILASSHNFARALKPQTGIKQNIPTTGFNRISPQVSTPQKEVSRISSREVQNNHLQDDLFDKVSPGMEPNGFINQVENARPPYTRRVTADPLATPISDHGLLKDSSHDLSPTVSGKRVPSDRPWTMISANDPMDVSWSHGNRDSAIEDLNLNDRLRWRSDETSEDEEEQSPERIIGGASIITPVRGMSRSRFARR
ncbi:hypothetical protein HHK36_000923 [Tetracentron sinense]|uniref:Uncharacterized protein n=1 Tax=Tetracentron sinense TaxID=13715 RepID=A0A835DR56_TETSI|nr:hypothetical protein HHK36_000923 [Tetracentron sinense]